MRIVLIVLAIVLLAALLWWLAPFAWVIFNFVWAGIGDWIVALTIVGFAAWCVYRYFKARKGIKS